MFREGPCSPLYIRGDKVTWKVQAEYSWSPTTTQSGSFLCTAASSTPVRVVTREVRYIHELSLTLEHSKPTSSPAAPGLIGRPDTSTYMGAIFLQEQRGTFIMLQSEANISDSVGGPRRHKDQAEDTQASAQIIKWGNHPPHRHCGALIYNVGEMEGQGAPEAGHSA